jgi:hypothetical protein
VTLPDDQPSWDWNRNRPESGVGGPTPYELGVGPNVQAHRAVLEKLASLQDQPDGTERTAPESGVGGPTPYELGVLAPMVCSSSRGLEKPAIFPLKITCWDWNRNRPVPGADGPDAVRSSWVLVPMDQVQSTRPGEAGDSARGPPELGLNRNRSSTGS